MAYTTTPSLVFDQIPGSLPPDGVPEDIDLSPFPGLAKQALGALREAVLCEDAIWRDFFALTGTLRTFNGSREILAQWTSCTPHSTSRDFQTGEARVSKFTPNSSWVDVTFTFSFEGGENGLTRNCFGILSFVPDSSGEGWKVWMLRTMLENFQGCGDPDDSSPIFSALSPSPPNHSSDLQPSNDDAFDVIVLGAGQCGLSLSGRLGALGIKYLLLEKEEEIGYSWTGKYDSVRQHTVKEMNNLPFERTYKPDDPILLPAATVARGFREFVQKYRINVWLGANTEKCVRKEGSAGGWELSVRLRDGDEVKVLRTKHLVLAMGGGVSVPMPPEIHGREKFRGDVLHMGVYKNCHGWKGKRGVVVGTGTTAHDVAQDMLDAGLESVTMTQRGRTPVFPVEWIVQAQSMIYNADIPSTTADRLVSLMPNKIDREIFKINFGALISENSSRFDDLEKSGFRVDRDAVLSDLLLLRGGGYYIDVGTSKRIADGDIKIKSGIKISGFTDKGLAFEDGEEIDADLVVFATGYERDIRRQAAGIIGVEIASRLPQTRVLNAEGEVSVPMTPSSEHLWVVRGSVNEARFQSRFIALQIQAELLGKPLPDCGQWSGIKEVEKS